MSVIRKITLIGIFIAVVMSASVMGQTATDNNQKAADQAEAPVSSGLKSKILTVRYRNMRELGGVVKLLGSGRSGAAMSFNESFKTITVRDFPENIATIEDALKRLDIPEPIRPDIELRIHILIASNNANLNGEYPPELNDVIAPLRSTLNYKKYALLASAYQRTKGGGNLIENKGVADPKQISPDLPQGSVAYYNYSLQSFSFNAAAETANSNIQIDRFNFSLTFPVNIGQVVQNTQVGFATPLSIRDGEKVVVGTTTVGDKGLIVVLSAKLSK